ncbi:MAG: uroporphyrinogen III synthase [Rhodobacteraceae bacterium]|nr:uroporphyrinogen III synthase [Paracoccaceae bacterium]
MLTVPNNPAPPSGPVLLLTRPRSASEALATRLSDAPPHRVVISPILAIRHLPPPPDSRAAGLIFSSANGVEAAASLPKQCPVHAVGDTTAAAARAAGWRTEIIGQTADDLVDRLIRSCPPTPLLHLHGAHTRGDIAARLTAAGLPTSAHVIYDQVAQDMTPEAHAVLNASSPVILPIFSPRSARLLSSAIKPLAPVHVIALSSAVAEEVHVPDMTSLHVCDTPSRGSMDAALISALRRLCRVEGSSGGD